MLESDKKSNSVQEEFQEMYYVVKNLEEQYSIWPSYKQIPQGWEAVGEPKIKPDCLSYIDEVWTDMRPLSLRKQMQ
ncbi:MAG: MbtH family NRPS accessory protein [Holosporales bacterium]|nr:MbtH family NRPS accessory protein [Holosporales bacterium]